MAIRKKISNLAIDNFVSPVDGTEQIELTQTIGPTKISGATDIDTIKAYIGGGATNLTYTASPTDGTVVSDSGTDATIPAGSTINASLMLPADKTKLDGVATGATANQTDAFLLARANHTGTQAVATITGLGALATQNTVDLAYTPSPTDGTVTSNQGTDATLTLAGGVNAGLMSPSDFTKLAGIATGATANQTDAFLLARANHTGTQTLATISDAGALASQNSVNLTYTPSPTNGLVASDQGTDATLTLANGTNAGLMTPADFTKLAGIDTGAQANHYVRISTKTASSSTSIDFTTEINNSLYRMYVVELVNIQPATDDVIFQLLLSNDGGSTFLATGYVSKVYNNRPATTDISDGGITTYWPLNVTNAGAGTQVGNVAAENYSGKINLFGMGTTSRTGMDYYASFVTAGGATVFSIGNGSLVNATAPNAIRFKFDAGNITTGTFVLYGIRYT